MANPNRSPSPSPSHAQYESEEWELVNDDGFVYKRKKRRLDPSALVRQPDPVVDPAVELLEKRKRKRKALLQLKDKYQNEIGLWEDLSNTLKALQNRNPEYEAERHGEGEGEAQEQEQLKAADGSDLIVSPSRPLFSDVLLLVESQEAIIRDFSQLCEVAESLCSVHEEKAKQQFIDLPIWKSPIGLMASFCED